ncbi:MAG: carbonic anhydrase family protein [Synergistaceae bacterium]|nr:carbonic anhydrase family protein [Synergistaceae bacterium]
MKKRRGFTPPVPPKRSRRFIGTSRSLAAIVLLTAFLAPCSFASDVHWSYSGEAGPENWENLSPAFGEAVGDAQSPIDITTENRANGVEFYYNDGAFSVLNNGHTLQATPAGREENWIVVDGVRFYLQQLHFHTPSEHTLNGSHSPMEIHFVHNGGGRTTVVGLFVDEGPENEALAAAWSAAPRGSGEIGKIEKPFLLTSLLPENLSGIRYVGSLTTPPTTEGVSWIILEEHSSASAAQIRFFTNLIGENARPTQPLNGRTLAPFQGRSGR